MERNTTNLSDNPVDSGSSQGSNMALSLDDQETKIIEYLRTEPLYKTVFYLTVLYINGELKVPSFIKSIFKGKK